ncbi:hypothetical protein ABIA39_005625 [Nocardia sp. GAS34]|uniref:hypothetical protein n=1 Tax=unclassified Nocardia TaxID=2637762 RepID=UPI003D1BC43B
MRRILFTVPAIVALAAVPGLAAANGLGASGVRVQALEMGQNFPVTGLGASVTPCSGGRAAATVTTGADGAATASVPLGCYRVVVTTVPAGCSLDGPNTVQVGTFPGVTPSAVFHVRCA